MKNDPKSGNGSVPVKEAEGPLDRAAIENSRELGGDEMLSELTRIFFADTGSNLAALNKSVKESDVASVERIAHTLKGSSSNMGATRMAAICDQLQYVDTSGKLSAAPALLEKLEAEIEHVRSALETEVIAD